MLSILINAYACSPNMGSEPGMAWNWCVNLANHCELYIITEGEFRDNIERVLPTLPQGKNMHFYYNPVSDKVRRMCWNQGDWRFYRHYRKWQLRTLDIAREIISEHHIDIVHQLNMIGFREPGYLWKIEDKPFVWGPIGGMELVPVAYLKGAGLKTILKNRIKNAINVWQMRHQPRVLKAINRADMLVAATGGAYRVLRDYHHKEHVVLINETGCYISPPHAVINVNKRDFRILWVGKFDFRKQLGLALGTVANMPDKEGVTLHIVGENDEGIIKPYRDKAWAWGISDRIKWHGKMAHDEVLELMRQSDVFLFTSINEGTPHVVLEAIQESLPVVCFRTCGQGEVVDDSVGCKVELSTPQESVRRFASILVGLRNDSARLAELKANCRKRGELLTWERKALRMIEIYKKITQ